MSTVAIIVIVVGALLVLALIAYLARSKATDRRRRIARDMRDKAEIRRAEAGKERATAEEQQARARRQAAEAEEHVRSAERDRAHADRQAERAAAIDPDTRSGGGRARSDDRDAGRGEQEGAPGRGPERDETVT